MFDAGLVSVSFRGLSPEEVLTAAQQAGIPAVEWGSDVHAPCTDTARLQEIAAAQQRHGICCCSYGTYFRLGVTPLTELPQYIAAAKLLGTDILRLWCGDKGSADYAAAGKAALFADCRAAAQMATDDNVTLCLECHNGTYTDTLAGALELMQTVDSPALRMYWQPNQFRTFAENLAYATAIAPYTTHIHAFHWEGKNRYPLAEGISLWQQYLCAFDGYHRVLLEFMPDDRPESLSAEAATLRKLIGGTV